MAGCGWAGSAASTAIKPGSVQTLSFVLTLPIFIMVMMLIVQVSQLMIGLIVVHYAAYAAARMPRGVDSRQYAGGAFQLHQRL